MSASASKYLGLSSLIFASLVACFPAVAADRPNTAADQAKRKKVVKVAVYDDTGSGKSKKSLLKAVDKRYNFEVDRLTAADIQAGRLAGHDVVIFPGGSAHVQAGALGKKGRDKVRHFVDCGGGYVGICAGAYLATCNYDWSLDLLRAKVVDRAHWARGKGKVAVGLTAAGRKFFGRIDKELTIFYGQGPLLAPGDKASLPEYTTLARYRGEIAKNGAPPGVMIGTTAIAAADYGKGRVLCFSPHPEVTQGLDTLVRRGVRWAAAGTPEGDEPQ